MERPALPKLSSPESPQASPVKPRKRDRLMSFISRARAGSVTKQSTSPTREEFDLPTPQSSQFGSLVSLPRISTGTSSKRTSRSVYAPQPMAVTPSTASTSSASDTSLVTPGASQPDVSTIQEHVVQADVFGTASPTFTPSSFMPDMSDNTDVSIIDDMYEPTSLEPTLPPPTPGSSTPSFFLPPKQEGLFASFARKTVRRRKKKLIVSWLSGQITSTDGLGRSQYGTAREREQRLREDRLLKWCESFGVVRRFERRENGYPHTRFNHIPTLRMSALAVQYASHALWILSPVSLSPSLCIFKLPMAVTSS
ncbi:hypothetical protein BDY19DRAFT_147077 [Irpex rosettiformis]|uniref:Uncharacterized protein n=1 Tax=Irpex rosettiformis TaxID=378272 RepID=A0ACB8U3H4_9APHY|nr:hypothetical protein BDY19DRAFT_147077 [Irpex rosettiformis]